MDAAPAKLVSVIEDATRADASNRYASVDEFLEYLGLLPETLTRPEPTDLLAVPTVQLVRGAGIGTSTRAEVRLLARGCGTRGPGGGMVLPSPMTSP